VCERERIVYEKIERLEIISLKFFIFLVLGPSGKELKFLE
jgi:hypothetical protein